MNNTLTLRGISVRGMRSAPAGSRAAWYEQIGPYRDAEIARLWGSTHRRRWARFFALAALVGIAMGGYLELANPSAQQALMSWISLGHADALRQSMATCRSTVMAVVGRD